MKIIMAATILSLMGTIARYTIEIHKFFCLNDFNYDFKKIAAKYYLLDPLISE